MAKSPAAILFDISGSELSVKDGISGSLSSSALPVAGFDLSKISRIATIVYDSVSQKNKLSIDGTVSLTIPPVPPGGVQKIIAADDPLSVSVSHDTSYLITSGTTFVIQQIVAGAGGDPQSKGSKIEIYYSSSLDGTFKLVDRVYVDGFTEFGDLPDTSITRDGTLMTGSGNEYLIIRRDRLGGQAQEVDAVLKGYEI